MRTFLILVGCLGLVSARGAERVFNFSEISEGKTPPGFRSVVAGSGLPGDWRIIMDEVSPTLKPLTSRAPSVTSRAVLAQKAGSIVDLHFPILLFDQQTFEDCEFSTRFKIVGGEVEQMAGIVFRYQDEKNFYVLRASVKDGTLRFYKMNQGQIEKLFGPKVSFKLGEWYEIRVICHGNQIQCYLDGQEAIPTLTDNGFPSGKIGFWTKSDSVAYFSDARIKFTPREPPAQVILRDTLARYSRLAGLKIVMNSGEPPAPKIIASKLPTEVGQPADTASGEVLKSGQIYYGREKGIVHVTMPLHDQNGEPVAAVKVTMESFVGQTEQNAIARAQPVVKFIQDRVQSSSDLAE